MKSTSRGHTRTFHAAVVRVAVPSSALLVCSPSIAQETVAAQPQKPVGGHVGVATALVTVADETTTIGDQFGLATPIRIGFHVSKDWIVDFETVVSNPVSPTGTTGLVVDPGIIYAHGRVAVGMRLAFKINQQANVGGIPLVNLALVDSGGAAWFVEAAFPTFYSDHKGEFNVVAHTGIGF